MTVYIVVTYQDEIIIEGVYAREDDAYDVLDANPDAQYRVLEQSLIEYVNKEE